MTVFRDVTIEWKGEAYTVTPSMRLLRLIEGENISLMHVAHEVAKGRPQASLMAFVISMVLRSAGAKATEEEIYAEIVTGDTTSVMALYEDVIAAISPTPVDAKKPEALDGE